MGAIALIFVISVFTNFRHALTHPLGTGYKWDKILQASDFLVCIIRTRGLILTPFWPDERRISPAQDKKKLLIRRPRFYIRQPKGI